MCRISIVNDDLVISLLHAIQWSLSQPIHKDKETSLIWDRFYYKIGISHVINEICDRPPFSLIMYANLKKTKKMHGR